MKTRLRIDACYMARAFATHERNTAATFKSVYSTFLVSALLAAFAFVAHTKSWSGPFHGHVTAERRFDRNAVFDSESRLASRRVPRANPMLAGSRRDGDLRIARAAECISQGCGEP